MSGRLPPTAAWFLGLLCALALACPETDPDLEFPTPPPVDDDDDDDDDTADPVEVVHEGDFGSLAVAPSGTAAFVRRIDDGDEWVTDEYDHRTRPRLLQIDPVDGSLWPLSERAEKYLWFTANDGALYIDDPDGSATVWFVDTAGTTTEVMDDWLGLRLDPSGRFVFAQTSSPRKYTLFDSLTAEHLLHDSEEFIPWRVTPDGTCVLGTTGEVTQLWRPATDEWTELQFPDGEPIAPSVLFDSCERVAYVRDDLVGWYDLAGGVDHPLATVEGNLSGMQLTASPDEDHLYWIDDAGLHGADLSGDSVAVVVTGNFADVERSPDRRHLALAIMSDALDWCGPIVLLDLDAGTLAMTTGIVCYEIVGYTMFTTGGGHVLWTDGPFSGMVSPVPAMTEVSYCPPWECWHPGVVDTGDRWLVVPRSVGPDEDGILGPTRVLSATSLADGGKEVTPFFESTEAYDYAWYEMVRHAADGDTLVFGNELVPHAAWEWPCPVELMAGSLSGGNHWSLADDAVDVEIDGADRLLYISGDPRHEESCAGWTPADGATPALHLVPADLWM